MRRSLMGMVLLMCMANFMVSPLFAATVPGDINNDGKVGLLEAIYALQVAAGIKTNVPSQQELEALEDAVNYASAAGTNSVGKINATEQLDGILSYLGLSEVSGNSALEVAIAMLNNGFNCGDVTRDGTSVTYTFSGNPDCGSTTGQITVTPDLSDGLQFNVVYTNVVQGDCTINGSGITKGITEGANLIITHQSDNLDICGQQLSGTTTMTYNALTQALISAATAGTYTYTDGQAQITTVVDLDYTFAGSKLNGTATIIFDGETYNCTFENVVIDPACGIPTSGVITINELAFDFSETTCENPTVTTTLYGIPVTLSLNEAIEIYQDS